MSAVCQTDLHRLQAGGVTAQFMSVFVHMKEVSTKNAFRRELDLIYTVRKSAPDNPQEVVVGTSSADIYQAKKDRKVAFLLGIKGSHALEGSLVNLHLVQTLGVRVVSKKF
ncbi:MAG TPA: membrane dipeptidase [Acidobacteriota bacterium]|nr:membrane dipeptidase [Acidobacteriota bacterium]